MTMRRFLAFLACCWLLVQPAAEARADLVVVVNVRSGVAAMTRNEIINIFFGRTRQFFNGIEAQPVDLAGAHPDRVRFYQALVGKELSEVNAYWSRQLFSGGAQQPVRVGSSEEVIKWVTSHPGGIGFIEQSKADARMRVVHEFGR